MNKENLNSDKLICYPLIQGEVHINYLNGIPAYYSCKHLNK